VKVGDLVRIAPYCTNKGRLALVVRTGVRGQVWIVYTDNGPHLNTSDGQGHAALIRNLELISESR